MPDEDKPTGSHLETEVENHTPTAESPPQRGPLASLPWRRGSWQSWTFAALSLVLFTGLYHFFGANLIYQTNQDRTRFDQQHNITLAELSAERAAQPIQPGENVTAGLWRAFPHYTDGVVNPLWPWIAAKLDDGKGEHRQLFERGKWFNLRLTALFLVVLGLICVRVFSACGAIIVVLLSGFGAFLERAVYFHPEPLYYILLLLCWICALALLRRNDILLYVAFGLTLGLAWLAKSSIQPLALAFLGVTSVRFGVEWWRRQRGKSSDERWSLPTHFIGLAAAATAFLIIAGPRMTYANNYYGAPMHSYPAYWMWMDDFEQGAEFMRNYPHREALETLTDEDRPSAGKYLREHSTAEVTKRMIDGVFNKLKEMLFPREIKQSKARDKAWKFMLPGRGWYLIWVFLTMIVISALRWTVRKETDSGLRSLKSESAGWMLAFSLATFAIGTAAYGFYTPIGKGDRFMLSMYAPLVLTFVWITERFRRQIRHTSKAAITRKVYFGMQSVLLLAISWRVLELLRTPLFRDIGKAAIIDV